MPARSIHVLLVEDNPGDVRLLQESLREVGEHHMQVVSEGRLSTALDRLNQGNVDVVLLDLTLPDGRGIETFTRMHLHAPNVPIVVLTGLDDETLAARCVHLGAQDYLVKGQVSGQAIARVVRYAIERKQAAEAVRESEERYRMISELSSDFAFAWSVRPDGTFDQVWLTEAFSRITGYTDAEILERGGWIGFVHADDEQFVRQHQEILRTGESDERELRILTREGEIRWLRTVGRPIWDDAVGQVTRIYGAAQDITARKRAENELETRARQQAAVAQLGQQALSTSDVDALIDDAVTILALILGVDFCSFQELRTTGDVLVLRASVGWDPGLMGQETPISGLESPAGYALLSNQRVTFQDLATETRFRAPESFLEHGVKSGMNAIVRGPDRPLGVLGAHTRRARVFTADDGYFLEAVANVMGAALERRRTELALAASEDQLRQSQKMEAVGLLAGGIAHDFNNLLSAIIGFSELVLMRLDQADPLRTFVEEIARAGDRAAGLTSQLLAFGRRQMLLPEIVDVNQIIGNLDQLLRRVIGEHIDLVTLFSEPPGHVRADRGQLEQVIMNLAVNARDAMPNGGKLTIEASCVELDGDYAREHLGVRTGPYMMIAVSDTGTGMDPETKARIFEPFFTTKEPGHGTGLGLSMAYGIVKQSEGDIWVYSEPGIGTTFKIYLPRVEAVAPLPVIPRRPLVSTTGSETVLVVEDEPGVRSLVRGVLQSNGYTVLEASRGEEALNLSEEHSGPIHLLLTDVVMPGMSGPELAKVIVRNRLEMKVLFMSGYTGDVAIRHGVLEEGNAYLQKPLTPTTLTRKVREVLDEGALAGESTLEWIPEEGPARLGGPEDGEAAHRR